MPDTLHPYQLTAKDWLQRHDQAGLFLDMGLGKTAATLSALEERHLPALVVAPKRVAENVWEAERRKWRPDLTMSVVKGDKDARARAFKADTAVHVLGRDNLRDITAGRANRYKTLVLDELSGFRSRSSVRWKAGYGIRRGVQHVWGLTGTPSPNGYLDLWAQIAMLDQGQRLGRTLTGFRERYFTPGRSLPNGIITEWYPRPGAKERIEELIQDICISMKSEDYLTLPPTIHNDVIVPLTPSVRKVYNTMASTLVANLDIFGGEVHTAANAATLSNKLSQLVAGFMYVDDADLRDGAYDYMHREKMVALQEIIDGTGSPVLVFYGYKAELEMIKEAIPKVRTIDEPGVLDDWDAGNVPVLCAHPASASHGLNLQHGGHTIVWTTLTWDAELWEQANRRLSRQGQKNPVIIHRLISPRTVDAAKLVSLQEKVSAQEALQDHLRSVV